MVSIEVFEGPLDLLLHLIRKHEIDIFDIPISFITDKYLEYLAAMHEMQLDIAVEYLEMAATLAHVKSQMLLPEEPQEKEGEEEGPDPREELVRRLLEYKKYKEAARSLAKKFMLGKHTFTSEGEGPEPESRVVADISVFDLLDIAVDLIQKARERGREGPQLMADRISVAERIGQIADLMKENEKLSFHDLLEKEFSVFDVVITFLALLEMVRLHMISVAQDESHGEIVIVPPVTYESIPAEPEKPARVREGEETAEPPPEAGAAGARAAEDHAGGERQPEEAQQQDEQPEEKPEPGIAGDLNELLTGFLDGTDKDENMEEG
jgi:segregation and condensation protein A